MKLIRLFNSHFFPLIVCGILALISCRVYLNPGLPSTHDSENHLARFANYKIALKEGQMPPRFAPNLYHRYGYPVLNYNYPLANILSVPFSALRVSYQLTFKILMVTSVWLMLFGMWSWLSKLKLRNLGKFLAVLSIAVSPYLLQTIIFRGSIGEVMAICAFVWWLVWVEVIRQRGIAIKDHVTSWKEFLFSVHTIVGGILLGTFFLSHNVTVLFGTPLMLIFSIWWLWQTKRSALNVFGAFVIGLGLSLWFWIPALAEQSAIIVGGSSLAQQFSKHFPTFQELLSSKLDFGFSFNGSVDSLSFALGWVQWLGLLCFVGWLLAAAAGQKRARKALDQAGIVFFVFSILCILFQLSSTTIFWQEIPLARFIQFPWRLGLFAMISNAALIAWLAQKRISWQTNVLICVILLQTVVAMTVVPIGFYNKPTIEYDLFEQSTTTSNENLPKDFVFQQFADWKPTAILLDGTGTIIVTKWSGSKRSYSVVATSSVVIVEPTMNFVGWETTVTSGNSYRLATYLDNKVIAGRIAYTLSPGTHQVQTVFTQNTLPRVVGNVTSTVAFAFVLGAITWIIYTKLKKNPTQNAS